MNVFFACKMLTNIAFISFTNVYYKMEKPKNGVVVFLLKTKIKRYKNWFCKKGLMEEISNFNGKSDVVLTRTVVTSVMFNIKFY